jgi:hypothetical protein
MITIPLTEEIRQKAKMYIEANMPPERLRHCPRRNWYYDDEAIVADISRNPNYVGLLGEIAIHKIHGISVDDCLRRRTLYKSDEGFDIDIFGGTYDIKTLRTAIPPQIYYRYNVNATCKEKYKNKGYIFNSLLKDESTLFSVGFLPKELFYEKAILHKVGDVSKTGNNFVFPNESYDIGINELEPIELMFPQEKEITRPHIKPNSLDGWM